MTGLRACTIPWHPRQQHSHPAGVRKTREQQSSANECGQAKPEVIPAQAEQRPCQHQRSRHNPHLAIETDAHPRPALHRQASLRPARNSAFDQHARPDPRPFEPVNGLFCASARLAKDIKRLFPGNALPQTGRVQRIERFQDCSRNMGMPELAWGSHIDQGNRLAGGDFAVEFAR